MQKIIPNLWFDRDVEQAVIFYLSTFTKASVISITRASGVGFKITGLREGDVMSIEFQIDGLRFIAINGGPIFKFNPSVSFLVACATPSEVDVLWRMLSAGGTPLMELGGYPFSSRYGWIQDKYGLSWQIMYMGERKYRQKITPTLMFVGSVAGRCEEAVRFYTGIFPDSAIGDIDRYQAGEGPDTPGTVRHAAFTLEGQDFAAMDSALMHNFSFNEAISLMVECQNQKEIDYYWDMLLSGGGQESACGWLKDKFGFSWQVAPVVLGEMLRSTDKEKVDRVTAAFLKMKKLDIAALKKAFAG